MCLLHTYLTIAPRFQEGVPALQDQNPGGEGWDQEECRGAGSPELGVDPAEASALEGPGQRGGHQTTGLVSRGIKFK